MSLIKWEPFGDIDRLFEEFGRFPADRSRVGLDMAIDVFEKGDDLVAEMNVPGMEGDDFDISVEDDMLRISGSHSEEREDKDKHYYSKEIRKGSFERVVRLPQHVDPKKVEAQYKKGVLTVTMPKVEGPKENKVSVKVND